MKLFKRKKKEEGQLENLESILDGHEIPSFPQVTMRALQRIRDPESTTEEIAETLHWDAGMVIKVLGVVNSAAYGLSRPIEDVGQAVNYLGRSQLEQIVLSLAVKTSLPSRPAPGFNNARFWLAASHRAVLSRQLASKLHPSRQAESFTVGLLQDMAVPVLANARPDDYGKVLESWHGNGDVRLEDIEQETFAWTHARVGAMLGQGWDLPPNLVQWIEGHHGRQEGEEEVPAAVRLVGLLRETRAEHGIEALVEEGRSDYGLDPDWTREAIASCESQACNLASMLT